MKKVTLFLVLLSSPLFSQKINFNGKLLDKVTQKPVVYANISFLEENVGISTVEDGTFSLEIDKNLLNKQIHISCLNYKDTVVFAKQLHQKTIFLQAKSIELDEVVISKKVDREIILDKIRRRVTSLHSSRPISMFAKLFFYEGSYTDNLFIKEIKIRFSNRSFKKSKFRVRVFSRDSITGLPKEDLLKESISITLLKKQRKVIIKLSKYDIKLPKNGVFIAFEKLFIPFNEYLFKGYKRKREIYYAPTIGLTYSKENINIERVYFYAFGKWRRWLMPESHKKKRFVPAISLTLSN